VLSDADPADEPELEAEALSDPDPEALSDPDPDPDDVKLPPRTDDPELKLWELRVLDDPTCLNRMCSAAFARSDATEFSGDAGNRSGYKMSHMRSSCWVIAAWVVSNTAASSS